jgi:succinyl-diaminopimelate desuccinylase
MTTRSATSDAQVAAAADHPSVVQLLRDLVRTPSRGGIDDYAPVIQVVTTWLTRAGLNPKVLNSPGAGPVAVTREVTGSKPGPRYVLDACLDTALGDAAAWTQPPFSGAVIDGWLHGRGASDSKAAIALFCHILARFAETPDAFSGTAALLCDLDEHTGGFAGIKAYLTAAGAPDGVLIGYPGTSKIVIGGRGFLRAGITIQGVGDHSATRRPTVSAISRAARLIERIENSPPRDAGTFGLPPRATVTAAHSGTPGVYSLVPDRCEIEVDLRLTPDYPEETAWAMLQASVAELDDAQPAAPKSSIHRVTQSWPAFRLDDDHELTAALLAGAHAAGLHPQPAVAGPSNIGCLLAAKGVPATAGFGVAYRGLHAPDEAIDLATVQPVQAAYHLALLRLMNASGVRH